VEWTRDEEERSRDEKADPPGVHIVRRTLLEYAERGVFRGFDDRFEDVDDGADPRATFRFFWIGPRPFRISLSPDGRTLAAEGLLPDIDGHPEVLEDLEPFVARRVGVDEDDDSGEDHGTGSAESGSQPPLPAHRRIDPDRAGASLVPHAGPARVDLVVSIRNGHHEYAVRKLLNLINEIWVRLQDRHQRYLWDAFEAPME